MKAPPVAPPHVHVPRCGARLFAAAVLAAALVACVHVPTEQERKQAAAEYGVALALVHEAQAAATIGERSQQDFKYRLALESLLKAHDLDPAHAEANYLLALVYFSGFQRRDEAERHLHLALKAREDNYPEADNLLGSILVDAGRPAEAVPFFDRARKNLLYKTPYFSESEMGWAYYKMGDLDRSVVHLRNALRSQPDMCGAYVKLAEVEEARNDAEAVQGTLDTFLQRCDTERLRASCGPQLLAWGYWRLGMTRLKAGDRVGAADALRTCNARFSDEPVASDCGRSLKLIE